jgi:hypothetical protein
MYLLCDPSPLFERHYDKYKQACSELVARCAPIRSDVLIQLGSRELEEGIKAGRGYLLKEGLLEYRVSGRPLLFIESGDIIGLGEGHVDMVPQLDFQFAARVDEFDFKPLLADSGWQSEYLRLVWAWNGMLLAVASTLCSEMSNEPPKLRSYSAGERVIEEGGEDDTVYTLVEGHAEVFVEGVKVGEILPDEIFGALAALAGTRRTATVVASQRCMIVSLPKHNFIELLRWRPGTVVKMVEDMARTIVSLNKKVVEQEKAKKGK